MTDVLTASLSDRMSLLPAMLQRYDRTARQMPVVTTDVPAYMAWRHEALAKLKQITGFTTFQTAPLEPVITEEVPCDGYIRQRVEIQTEPGVIMPLFVLVPDAAAHDRRRRPAMIAAHGHGSGGKVAPAGVRVTPEVAKAIDHYHYAYGPAMARAGFVTFCPDARGFGERMQPEFRQNPMSSNCLQLNQMGYPLGQTVTGMWAWDLHRLVDYIQTRDDCDPDRIGCAGLSGGGLQTLWATAFDERIRAAVISGYYYGYRQSLLEQYRHCSCNYVPGLFLHVDMGDIGGLIAPRPLRIETGDADPLNGRDGLANVRSQVAITQAVYHLLGAQENLVHHIFPGEHRWDGRGVTDWLHAALA